MCSMLFNRRPMSPTGGVSVANLAEFLSQPNVAMVGGSWLVPLSLLEAGDWPAITRLASEASAIAQSVTA